MEKTSNKKIKGINKCIHLLILEKNEILEEVGRLLSTYRFDSITFVNVKGNKSDIEFTLMNRREINKDDILNGNFDEPMCKSIIVNSYNEINYSNYNVIVLPPTLLSFIPSSMDDGTMVITVDTTKGLEYEIKTNKRFLVVDYQMLTYKKDRIQSMIDEIRQYVESNVQNSDAIFRVMQHFNIFLLYYVFGYLNKEQITKLIDPNFDSWNLVQFEENSLNISQRSKIKDFICRKMKNIKEITELNWLLNIESEKLAPHENEFINILRRIKEDKCLYIYKFERKMELHENEHTNDLLNNFIRAKSDKMNKLTAIKIYNLVIDSEKTNIDLKLSYFKFWFGNLFNLRFHKKDEENTNIEALDVQNLNKITVSGLIAIELLKFMLRTNYFAYKLKTGS